MADERFVVDLILNARDNTAAAIAKAIGNTKALNALQDEQKRQADELGNAYQRMSTKLNASQAELNRQTQSYTKNLKQQKDLTEDQVKAIVKLEDAAKRYARANTDSTTSDAKRLQLLQQLRAEEDKVAETLDRNTARRITNLNTEIVRVEALTKTYEEAARRQSEAERKAARERADIQAQASRLIQQGMREEEAQREAIQRRQLAGQEKIRQAIRDEQAEREALARREARLDDERKARFAEEERRERARVDRQAQYERQLREAASAQRQAEEARLGGADRRVQIKFDTDSTAALAQLELLAAEIRRLDGKEIDIQVDLDAANFRRQINSVRDDTKDAGNEFNFLKGLIGSLGEGFDASSGRIASFDNFLRGLLSLGVALFFEQLVLLAGAAGGALLALASSAGVAATALGGTLVAGIAQALGPLGLLVTMFSRVKNVIDAVKQANLLQQQQSYQGGQQAKREADANDTLAAANERLAEAQKKVNEAREQAAQKLEDLILQERSLQLGLEGTEEALRKAAARGDTAALPGLQLQRDQQQTQLGRVSTEIGQRQGGASPEVDAARQSVTEAARALDRAKRSADEASEGITAAAGKLDFLLGQLSPAERRLYEAMTRIQDTFRGFAQNVTAPMVDSFTRAIDRINGLLKDNRIIGAAKSLATEMSTQFDRIFDSFTSNDSIGQMLRITQQAKENLAPLTDIVTNFGHAFLDLAEAAGPAFSELLDWVKDISQNIADFFSAGRKSGELQQFFKDGVDQLKTWGDLLWQIIRLFAAIAGPGGGAKSGQDMVKALADTFRDWADQINDTGSKANRFFQNFFDLVKQMLAATKPIFASLADEFRKTFNKDGVDSVQGFSEFIANVLIPGLGKFARFMGSVTTAIADFARQHPIVNRIGAAVLATAASVSVLARAFTFLGPVIGVLGFLIRNFKNILETVKGVGGVLRSFGGTIRNVFNIAARQVAVFVAALGTEGGPAAIMAEIGSTARTVFLGPLGLITIFVLLAAKFGEFGKLWNALKEGLAAGFDRIKGPLKDVSDSARGLFDAFGKGSVVFIILKPVLDAITNILGHALVGAFKAVGDVLGGVLEIFSGFLDILTGILTFKPDKIVDGFKKLGRGIVQGVLRPIYDLGSELLGIFVDAWHTVLGWFGVESPSKKGHSLGAAIVQGIINGIKSLPGLIVKAAEWFWDKFKDFVRAEIRGWKAIGTWIYNALKDGVSAVANKLLDIGKSIGRAIIKGIKSIPGEFADAVKGAVSGRVEIFGHNVNPLAKAKGGAVVGPGTGTSDSIPALLSTGEHVWTAAEVAAAGGHSVMFALRRMLGGGTRARGRGFAQGGPVTGAGPDVGVSFSGSLDDFRQQWGAAWDDILSTARKAANGVEAQLREMRVNSTNTLDRMYRDMRSLWGDIADSAEHWTGELVQSVKRSMGRVQTSTYSGMSYLAGATNDALKAFDAKPVDISVRRPNADGKASGGWIGNSGERGSDQVPVWLGRGEAVLNWAHQKVVNSALWNQYGMTLGGLFKSSYARHAGAFGDRPGFAEGGYSGPGHSGSGFTPVWNMAKNKFGMTYFTGYDGHNRMTSSGNVSDHYYHRALDMGNGPSPTPGMDALNAFFKTKLPQVVKQLIWRNQDQFNGYPIGGHMNHVHLAMKDAFAFDSGIMARLISRASRGMSVKSLLAGVSGDENLSVDHVDRLKVNSSSDVVRRLLQRVFDRVRRAANRLIDGRASEFTGGTDALGLHGDTYDGPLDRRFPQHGTANSAGHVQLSPTQVMGLARRAGLPARTFEQIAHGESNYYPGIVSLDGGYGLWQMTPRVWGPSALSAMSRLGGVMEMLNPWKNAQMAKFLYDGAGQSISPWYGTRFVTGAQRALGGFAGLPHYATGGEIPGHRGQAIPIMAHAREWVVNEGQQMKLARILGTTVGKLRDMLGFRGGPKTYAGGGSVEDARMRSITRGVYESPTVDPDTLAGIEHEIFLVSNAISNMSTRGKLGARLGRFFKNIRALTDDDGLLDQMSARIEAVGERLERSVALAKVGFERMGNRLVRRDPLISAVEESDLAIEQYEQVGEALRKERAIARRNLEKTRRRINEILADGKITSGEEDDYQQLMAARKKFRDTMDEVDSNFAQNRADLFNARTERFSNRTDELLRPSNQALETADLFATIGNATDNNGFIQAAGQARLEALKEQQDILGKRYQAMLKLAARDPRWQAAADALRTQYLQVVGSVVTQIRTNLEQGLSLIQKGFGEQDASLEILRRLNAASGNTEGQNAVARAAIDQLKKQAEFLDAVAAQTAATDPEFSRKIQAQAAELRTKAYEATVQLFNDLFAQFEKTYENNERISGLLGRYANLRERAGDRLGAIQARQGISDNRITSLTNERAGLLRLWAQAEAGGASAETIKTLTDRIEELNISIEEENQTRRDLVYTYRQTATDIITGEQNRTTGLLGSAGSLLERLGSTTGNTGILKSIGDALALGARKLARDVSDAIDDNEFGSGGSGILAQLNEAFQEGPGSFASKLAELAPAIAALESTMGETERTAFAGLINALIENTTATVENSDAVNGSANPQSFSTSSWNWFREAIFNGMGDVLPQYKIPGMASGGYISKGGLFELHPGEFVTPAKHVSNMKDGDINITMNAVDGRVDLTSLASRIAFEKKSR